MITATHPGSKATISGDENFVKPYLARGYVIDGAKPVVKAASPVVDEPKPVTKPTKSAVKK